VELIDSNSLVMSDTTPLSVSLKEAFYWIQLGVFEEVGM
jgi:hypothetical protein